MDFYGKVNYSELVGSLRKTFKSHKTLPYEHRLRNLKNLLRLYEENNDLILHSLKQDMNKSKLEGYLYEVDLMKNAAREAIRNLRLWMSDTVCKKNILTPADQAYIVKEPLGVVLVIGPWNYPWQLTLVPLCGAIAAGNCALIKPSELAINTAQTMAKLIPKYLDPECYKVVLGGPMETQLILEEKFDHVFYTGNYHVAKEIQAKVSRHLTTTTFELGGKSPCYMDETCNFYMAAQRIMWGKCMNMGQTCVAPDYILCTKAVEAEFIRQAKIAMVEWYGPQPGWRKAEDLARIINKRHFHRLVALLRQGNIAMGGNYDERELWIEPSIITDVRLSDDIMREEIFGPILAIHNVESEDEAMEFINSRECKPLCLYVFSNKAKTQERFQVETQSGTMAFNDTIIQFAVDELPFGGIGESGHGSYHGKFSFDAFTHEKAVVKRDFSWIGDKVGMFRYPPYTAVKINFLSFLLCHWKKFKFVYLDYIPHLLCFIFGILFCNYFM